MRKFMATGRQKNHAKNTQSAQSRGSERTNQNWQANKAVVFIKTEVGNEQVGKESAYHGVERDENT